MGIETKTKELQVFFGGAKKADWDVGMAVDAIKIADRIDAIVLATGDGDFVPLVEYLRAHGVQTEVISFGKSSSSRLREAADEFIDMSDQSRKFLLNNRFNIPGVLLQLNILTCQQQAAIQNLRANNHRSTPMHHKWLVQTLTRIASSLNAQCA